MKDQIALLKETCLADEKPNDKLYRAEYLGSGTFIISKPKRKKTKRHETKVHNPQRRARR
ncbi:MAG: hypothetical protein IPM24_12840 [Bryobacterales bacterium]|nr:hypothetical protein [Bryobacterales bacterium]